MLISVPDRPLSLILFHHSFIPFPEYVYDQKLRLAMDLDKDEKAAKPTEKNPDDDLL